MKTIERVMFGVIQFGLALAVIAGHLHLFSRHDWHFSAVVVFFMLAGTTTALSFGPQQKGPLFLKKRLGKIYFPYLFVLALAVMTQLFLIKPTLVLSLKTILINALPWLFNFPWLMREVPLVLYQTWFLGPLLLWYPLFALIREYRFVLLLSYAASFLFFCLGLLGYLDAEFFMFRSLMGVWWLFLAGFYVAQMKLVEASQARAEAQSILNLSVVIVLFLGTIMAYQNPIRFFSSVRLEVLLGFIAGLGLIEVGWARQRLQFDRGFSWLALWLFYLHVPLIELGEYYQLRGVKLIIWTYALSLTASVLMSQGWSWIGKLRSIPWQRELKAVDFQET